MVGLSRIVSLPRSRAVHVSRGCGVLLFLSTASALLAANYELEVPFRSTASGIAELYYDTGSGFTRDQRAAVTVAPTETMKVLHFSLPTGIQLRALRFDPLNGAGSFEIGPMTITRAPGKVVRKIRVSAYRVRQQLTIDSSYPDRLNVTAPPGFLDPNLVIQLDRPLDLSGAASDRLDASPKQSAYSWPLWMDTILTLLAVAVVASALRPTRARFKPIERRGTLQEDAENAGSGATETSWPPKKEARRSGTEQTFAWLDRWAESMSDVNLILFNCRSLSILLAALAIFTAFSALGLHGSSTSLWDYHIAAQTPHSGLLWGKPKQIRSDELSVFTPNIFSQVYSRPPYRSVNRTIGGLQSVLFWSQPANHFIEIPRVLMWPFHLFSVSAAFSIYWNLKGLVLFLGSYLLLLILTSSRPYLSAGGAIWIYFSGYTQWWFSHCLPEQIGFAALTLVGALYIVLARKPGLIWAGTVVFTVSALNFALVFYPAFGVPLMWVMIAVGAGICLEKRRVIFGPDLHKVRWLHLGSGIILCAAVLLPFAIECHPTIALVRNTVYPGHRFETGGSGSWLTLFCSFIDVAFTEGHVPKGIMNICEGANFYLLGLLLLPVIFIPRKCQLPFSAIDILVAVCALAMLWFDLVGFPPWLASATLLSSTTTGRIRAAIGVAAVILVVRHLSRGKADGRVAASDWQVALALLALLVTGYFAFSMVSEYELPPRALLTLFAGNGALILLAVAGQSGQFFVVMLAFLLTHNFLINPVARGFRAVTGKKLYQKVCEIHESDPDARWVVFGSFQIANFLKFSGVEVINGNKFYPVQTYNNVLDPGHRFIEVWNRYAHIAFADDPACREAKYELIRGLLYRVRLAAQSPALGRLGVRYVVFTYPPPAAYRPALLETVHDGDKSFWILHEDFLVTTP